MAPTGRYADAARWAMTRFISSLAWLLSSARWKGFGYVVDVQRERVVVATGKTSTETNHCVR